MRIKLKRVVREDEEVDVVTALRARAAEHVKRELERKPRKPASLESMAFGGDDKPVDLWTAKLCLEIASLFQHTETENEP